jgi:hypothetical protein
MFLFVANRTTILTNIEIFTEVNYYLNTLYSLLQFNSFYGRIFKTSRITFV